MEKKKNPVNPVKKKRYKLETWLRLGLSNIAFVALYRLAKRFGVYRYTLPVGEPLRGPFLSDTVSAESDCSTLSYFSHHTIDVTTPPDWFVNPWNGIRCADADRHWTEIPDFMPELGDIKTVWEASRFDWLPRMAWAYRCGDESALGQLELWLRDWAVLNPVNGGINWKCGQETSLRCLNLLVGARYIDTCFDSPRKPFLQLLHYHLQRVTPTLRYAMAQDNNHGVSEAAALFVVGKYLGVHGNPGQQKDGRKWHRLGRKWLQNRVEKLVMTDGSFSQHSVTYHRLMLDVLSLVELLRVQLDDKPLADIFYSRARAAVRWLQQMTDSRTGDAPNMGANDGAYLFNLGGYQYRDFRPSVQLGAAVFLQQSVWGNEVQHPLLEVCELDSAQLPTLEDPVSTLMAEGGYACLRTPDSFAMLRLPIFKFRPSHADGLHLDLWHNGVNWVRDAGTFSYNADDESLQYFPGTASHSTVCFDDRDQMPRLGRFLFGAWLKPNEIEWRAEENFIRSSYTDYLGAYHCREVQGSPSGWCVVDRIKGFADEAVVRWHLAPAAWQLDDMVLSCEQLTITVQAKCSVKLSLVELPESRYYLEQQLVPVLEIRCPESGTIKTTFCFV